MSVVNLNEVRELKENELGSAKQVAELNLPDHLSMLLPLRSQFNVNVLEMLLENIREKLCVNGSFAHYKEDKYFKFVFQLESLLYGYVKVTYS